MPLCEIYDDIFDAEYLYEIYNIVEKKLKYSAKNVANRRTFPYGTKGTHKLMGTGILHRKSPNEITFSHNETIKYFNELFFLICGLRNTNPHTCFLDRIDVNLQHSGCHGTLHRDAPEEETDAKTFMVMVNPEWSKDWGGEFVLYSQDKKTLLEKVDYKAGRVIVFPSNYPHTGYGAKSEYSYVYRYTIVFGVKPLN